ncbi:MAG: DUF4175 family protein [Planctomycetes bacterium]|nr:DUF4175 family protein [Planctomycetota bacterium]
MIQVPADAAAGALPQPIAQALRRLIRRIREVILLRGISAVVATAAATLLLIMAIDARVVLFSDLARWLLTLSALAATAASAIWFLILPLARTITLTGIARAIEERHPELQERISSAVELLTSRDMPEIRGSQALINALADEACRDAAHVRPRAEVPLKSARPFLLAAAGGLIVFAALLSIYPSARRLLLRAVAPYLNLPNISAESMLRIRPGDAVIAEGQRLQVEVDVTSQAVHKAQFRKLMPDGSESAEAMTALPPGENDEPRFAITCPPAAESFRYRVHAGDALSRYYTVTVVPPPVVKRLELRYDFPAYTGLAPVIEPDSAGEIKAVAGTAVTVSAVTNKPVKSAELQINGRPAEPKAEIATGPDGAAVCKFVVKLAPRMRGRWALNLSDEYGFSNSTGERILESLPDAPPVVKILAPEDRKLRLKPSDRLPVAYAMTDDFGLRGAEFSVETDSRKRHAVPLPLGAPGETSRRPADAGRAAAGEAALDLASLPLLGARQFTFRLRGTDNLPRDLKGPQEGFSETVTVELDMAAPTYAMQVLAAEEEAIRKALEKILHELKKSKEDSVPLKSILPKLKAMNEDATKRLDRMRGHLGTAKATVAELLPRVQEGTFTGLAPKMASLATEVDGAHDKSGQVKLVETPDARGTLAAQTDVHIDRAIQIVLELLQQLHEMAGAARLAQSLEDLADRQEDLAAAKADAEMGADEPPLSPSDWQKAEAQVSRDVGSLVRDTAAARQAQLAQDQARAKDLAAEARRLQQEQTALAQDTARLSQIQQVDSALGGLAAEQAALAREAAGERIAADQSPPMAAAAENIKAGALAPAVQQQKAAEAALAQRAQTGALPAAAQQATGQQAGAQQAGQPAGQETGQQQAGAQQAGQQQAGQPAGQQTGQQQAGAQQAGQQQAGQPAGQQTGQQQAGAQQAGQQQAGQQAGAQQAGQQQAGQPAGQQTGQQQAGAQQAGQQQAGTQQAGAQQAGAQQATPQEQARAGQLAARQQDIRRRTEALLAQRNQAAGQIAQSQMSRLKAEQTQVAREAARLAQAVAPAGQQPAQLGQQAAGNAQEAADAIPSNIAAAAENATEAGQQLGALTQNLNRQVAQQAAAQAAAGQQAGAEQAAGEQAGSEQAAGQQAAGEQAGGQQAGGQPSAGQPSAGQPSTGQPSAGQPSAGQPSGGQPSGGQPSGATPAAGQMPQLAQRSGDLAERQQALAREMQALAAQQPQQALLAEQQSIQAQTADLAQDATALAERTQAVAPQLAGAAQQALGALGQAQQAEGQAGQALQSSSPSSATGAQHAAASALGQAAGALGSLGQALAKAAGQAPASPNPVAGPMANAYSAASQAAQSQTAASAAAASQAMSAAAGQAMAAAQGMGVQPGQGMMGLMPGMMPSQTRNSQKGISAVGINLTAAKLESLGIKLSDWARLPGELRNQILQAAEEAGPEEYRALIKRYFQQVAKRGSAESEASPP